ncbi:succinate dehydrogenase hydrophobic membrane anchor subunit [Mycolicibacter arupensis]|jgi:succinate dehydrogenase / fumarate reductase membrane anchor subunit|uniref:Succinate dehydrogenase n=1 Tax=Mycolicibacter arupensis TaxID=342002 RepID=A0A0F5MSR2_9MYCO|nr:succinate dehydrogenase hydrophobic membrane anchor subunit [Mycolicibacter arupensis]KAA1433068.1 succinate dehydrogenase hydrophobic membrane anchor subunit [Mycolicibacter arupensis]KKB97711.1 succinate dehydrogenase [Mycolicibacter arupensis]MCV7276066.1 succinate dehydrogenase hydrophobic membrane anchor subunit [Mycolicibacter arupensis]ORA01192.1 succinate dehydrogenase [Mycolicibacter arupensis]TXI58963.1 MAG: succinate dehydrogenase [Mycolicibacter arupensis]
MSTTEVQGSRGPIAPILGPDRDRPASLGDPRSPQRHSGMANFEKYTWLFMRFSGAALIFLVLGHLFVMLMWQDGVYRIDFNYVAERWHHPYWQIWDLCLLWLAELHGANGLRTIIGDYTRSSRSRFWLMALLAVSVIFTLMLGSYVLLSFDANIS